MLRFSDGEEFDTNGELRLECRSDGWYVLGQGLFIPVSGKEEGQAIIREMAERKPKPE